MTRHIPPLQRTSSFLFKFFIVLLVPLSVFFYCPDASVSFYYINNFDAVWKYGPFSLSKDPEPQRIHTEKNKHFTYWIKDSSLPVSAPDIIDPIFQDKTDSILIVRWKNKYYQLRKQEIIFKSPPNYDTLPHSPSFRYATLKPDSHQENQLKNITSPRSILYDYTKTSLEDSIADHPEKISWTRARRDYINQRIWKKITQYSEKTSSLPVYGINILWLFVFLLFLRSFSPDVYASNSVFLFVNLLMSLGLWTITVFHKWGLMLYAAPMILFPLTLLMFFHISVAASFWLVLCMMCMPYFPDKTEFLTIFIFSGFLSLLVHRTFSERKKLFILFITYTGSLCLMYALYNTYVNKTYILRHATSFIPFLVSGASIFLTPGLVYVSEKLFGLTSEFRLLELTDLRHPLLHQLSEQAPGTYHHSLQVSAMAEEGAFHLNANTLLVRVGAMYHDIGKIYHPELFIENRTENEMTRNELTPEEYAQRIIEHVRKGIELGYAHALPESVIDFIRTHHGNSRVEYFYKLQLNLEPGTDEKKFRYPGPLPFNKETAIVMLADSVEAASRSLKNPDEISIHELVDKIFSLKTEDNQLINSELTFKDIQTLKKLFKKRLIKIYHRRISQT